MGTDKRARQKEGRQARIAAAEATKRKADQRRRWVTIGLSVVAIVALAFGVNAVTKKDKKSTDVAATDTSVPLESTTTTALASVAGQPCVAMSDTLPAGAPNVPVKVGPAPTTLIKEDLKVGTGAEIKATDTVTVNYIGVSCSTGKIFDASYTSGKPVTFPLNQVIKGWTDGIPGMKAGGQRLLGIPADQAYGATGRPGIAPDEALWFVVDVTATTPAGSTPSTSTPTAP
jgi:FKBP-type peptidyl-prolyl cis-trans isomerase